jgi:hypothetical protein
MVDWSGIVGTIAPIVEIRGKKMGEVCRPMTFGLLSSSKRVNGL